MPVAASDEAFADFLRKHGMAGPSQVLTAREFQADLERKGERISLADAMVGLCFITQAQREEAEQRIQAQDRGAIHQLLHYRLIRKIGEGTMGVVYLAEDVEVRHYVALKVLGQRYARNRKFIQRFEREADATARLYHENIVRAYAFGEDQGRNFYVMEYCGGETLDRRLKREKYLPHEEATGIVIQVARGLKYAHEKGFIHRDIKPANIIMSGDVAKILDLGLTKNIGGEEESLLTQTGLAMGTPHYISPEQGRGEGDLDGRTDVYSLGATYYHFVTGEHAFHGPSAYDVISKHIHEPPPDPRSVRKEVPEGVARVIRRMMAKKRADRYRDCGELLQDLEGLVPGKEIVPCGGCGKSLRKDDFARGKARRFDGVPCCAECRPVEGGHAGRGALVKPSTARLPRASLTPSSRYLAPPRSSRLPLIAGGALAGAAILVLLAVALSGRKEGAPESVVVKAVPPREPAASPGPAEPAPVTPAADPGRPGDEARLDALLAQAREIRDADPKFARSGEVMGLLKAALDLGGPRRVEVERVRADYEKAAGEARRKALGRRKGPYELDRSGHIQNWLILGPFPNANDKEFYTDYLRTEEQHEPAEGVEVGGVCWAPYAVEGGMVNFFLVPHLRLSNGQMYVIEYAACWLECDRDMEVEIRLGSDDGFRLWVDGEVRMTRHVHRGVKEDEDTLAVKLGRGLHPVLLKVDQGEKGHGFVVRVVTPEGGRPSGIRVWN